MKIIIYSKKYGDKEVLIDKEDFEKVKKYVFWHLIKRSDSLYHVCSQKNKKTIYLHRLIMGFPKNKEIDHINGNGLDNRKNNLRICTHCENLKNQKPKINNTTGYKGVTFHKASGKYFARIKINYVTIYLGLYKTPKLAYKAYCEASKKYHKKFGRVK